MTSSLTPNCMLFQTCITVFLLWSTKRGVSSVTASVLLRFVPYDQREWSPRLSFCITSHTGFGHDDRKNCHYRVNYTFKTLLLC